MELYGNPNVTKAERMCKAGYVVSTKVNNFVDQVQESVERSKCDGLTKCCRVLAQAGERKLRIK